MKIIKIILAILVVVVLSIIIAGILAPSHIIVQRSLMINTPVEPIYNQINNLKNWESWSPWHKLDTTMKINYNTIAEGVGASYKWKGNQQVGSGELTITFSSKDSICTVMNFMENGMGTAKFVFTPSGEHTNVTWSMQSDMGSNPFKKLFGYLMDKIVGAAFEQGLNDLKHIAENTTPVQANKFNIEEVEFPERMYILKKDSMNTDSVESFFSKNLPVLIDAANRAKLQISGAPVGLYFSWDETTKSAVMAVALPVAGSTKIQLAGYSTINIPAGKNLHINFIGSYSGIGEAHKEMELYMQKNNLLQGIPVIEEHVTGPGQEADSSKWITNIYYPVK